MYPSSAGGERGKAGSKDARGCTSTAKAVSTRGKSPILAEKGLKEAGGSCSTVELVSNGR